LVLSGQAFLPKWDRALQEAAGREYRAGQTFPYTWWQRQVLQFVENPSRLKMKTPPDFVPCSRHSVEQTVSRFLGMHQELAYRLARCRGLDVSRVRVQSPFVAWMRHALGFSFDLALAHERRHLIQAWYVRRQIQCELSPVAGKRGLLALYSGHGNAASDRTPDAPTV
jgi:hypothetical protein